MPTTVLRANLEAIDAQFLRDLRDQFGPAEIELRVGRRPKEWLTEARFWALIARLDWTKTGDDAAVVEPLVAALAEMPLPNIHQFLDILSEKLWLLDSPAHARASVGGDEKGISGDGFLYDRCCVVANGKAFFESVLRDPSLFPVGFSFEPLLSVASEAYFRKTGRDFEHLPKFDFETGANAAAWAEKAD